MAGLAIYDTMQFVRPKIVTTCIGMAASMTAILLAAGEKGKRYALPNARIMVHQPMGGAQGQAADIEIRANEILRMKDRLAEILSHHTGQPMEKVERDTDRDFYLSADEALEYGIVDSIYRSDRETDTIEK